MKSLRIQESVIKQVQSVARVAGRLECVGLLAKRPAEDFASGAIELPSVATNSSAVATPLNIKLAVKSLEKRGLVPMGLYHSHGSFSVFHSATDDQTVRRLLPALAPSNYERRAEALPPMVAARDQAVLFQRHGYRLRFILRGEPISGTGNFMRSEWSSIETIFQAGEPSEPMAQVDGDTVILSNGEVVLRLRMPSRGTVEILREDVATYKVATLFSLVVNNRDEEFCESLMVYNFQGETVFQQGPCGIERLKEQTPARHSVEENNSSARACV